jgi:hypothetical protein
VALPTVPATCANVATPLPDAVLMPSFHLKRTPSSGSRTPSGPPALSSDQGRTRPIPETRSCARRSAPAGPSGDDEAEATAGAGPRYEEDQKTVRGTGFPTIGCLASGCRVNAGRPRPAPVRSQNSRPASPFRTAPPRSEHPSPTSWDGSSREQGIAAPQPICATEPCLRRGCGRVLPRAQPESAKDGEANHPTSDKVRGLRQFRAASHAISRSVLPLSPISTDPGNSAASGSGSGA